MMQLKRMKGLHTVSKYNSHLCELSKKELSEQHEKIIEATRVRDEIEQGIAALETSYQQIVENDSGLDVNLLKNCSTHIVQHKTRLQLAIKEQQELMQQYRQQEQALLEHQQSKKVIDKLIERKQEHLDLCDQQLEVKGNDELMVLRFNSVQERFAFNDKG